MEEEEVHPTEGDTLVLTDIVHNRAILGTGLPCGYELANTDQTFDEYPVEVVEVNTSYKTWDDPTSDVSMEFLTLRKPDGDTVKVTYRGREPIAGTPGGPLRVSNSQRAEQAYVWEKKE